MLPVNSFARCNMVSLLSSIKIWEEGEGRKEPYKLHVRLHDIQVSLSLSLSYAGAYSIRTHPGIYIYTYACTLQRRAPVCLCPQSDCSASSRLSVRDPCPATHAQLISSSAPRVLSRPFLRARLTATRAPNMRPRVWTCMCDSVRAWGTDSAYAHFHNVWWF